MSDERTDNAAPETEDPSEGSFNKLPAFAPPEAARSFSAGAFVLAGFCFASIVLLVQLELSERSLAYERPVGALLTAFLGCVISGFLMSIVVGQTHQQSDRTFWLALMASIALASSCLIALWGLADLVAGVFETSNGLPALVRGAFVVAGVLAACFVSNTAVDLLRMKLAADRVWVLLAAQAVAVVVGVFSAIGAGASSGSSIYLVAGVQLLALMMTVAVAVHLATFGKLEDWGRAAAVVATSVLVFYPTFVASVLFVMLL